MLYYSYTNMLVHSDPVRLRTRINMDILCIILPQWCP